MIGISYSPDDVKLSNLTKLELGSEQVSVQTRRELILSYKSGNDAATTKLIGIYYNAIMKQAHRFKTYAEFSDLMQSGICGLMKALEKVDVTKNEHFDGYITTWIIEFMQVHVRQMKNIVKIPVNKSNKRRLLERTACDGVLDINKLGLTDESAKRSLTAFFNTSYERMSINAPVEGDDMVFDLVDSHSESAVTVIGNRELHEKLPILLSELSEYEVDIINSKFGLAGQTKSTYKSIAKKYNVSTITVYTDINTILTNLKKRLDK